MDALPEFTLVRPETLDEVIAARAAHPDSSLIGGGTDLDGQHPPRHRRAAGARSMSIA